MCFDPSEVTCLCLLSVRVMPSCETLSCTGVAFGAKLSDPNTKAIDLDKASGPVRLSVLILSTYRVLHTGTRVKKKLLSLLELHPIDTA